MPVAQTRLEILQVCKLLQCVREKNTAQIQKLTSHGVPHLVNFNDSEEGFTALGVAAAANDDEMIDFLIELGAHPDAVDLKGRSPSMRAAEFGHTQCLERLVKAGAKMDLKDLEGKGILFYCISPTERHAKCLEIAVQNGADPNNISNEGVPVFLFACETAADNEEACLQLLLKGANPNGKQDPPENPSRRYKSRDVPPNDPNVRRRREQDPKTGRTCLMAAASSGSVKVVRAILEAIQEAKGDMNALDIRHNHASHFAALNGHFEVLACMSGHGAVFDQTNADGNTPIHYAAMNGHGMCCKFLTQRGCNPKPKNNEGETARSIAKDREHKEATKECRKAEKSFGKVGKNNEPWAITLYDWVFERQQKILNMCMKYDPDEKGQISKDDFADVLSGMDAPIEDDGNLKTLQAAHDKAKDGNVDYNDFLAAKKWVNKNFLMSAFEGKKKKKGKKGKGGKKKGKFKLVMPICTQDEGPRTYGGAPPEMFIEQHIHFTDTNRFDRDRPPVHPLQDDSAWYLEHPEKMYVNITDATKNGDLDSLKAAFQRGTSVDTRDRYYKTPLMIACAIGKLDMVKFLVEQGANINAQDNFKWTPLHHACHGGQLDVVNFLIDAGASMDATTMNGGTPLTRAIESSRDQVVDYLISKGCKVQTENKKGNNPLDNAMSWADPRVIDIVQAKMESLPPMDKKGKGKKGGGAKGGGKRPTSVPPGEQKESAGPMGGHSHSFVESSDENLPRQRKGSILRAASALAGGLDEQEDITYTPLKAWTKQPSSKELIQERVTNRERYGWEVDFEDFQMPFNKNVTKRVEIYGGDED